MKTFKMVSFSLVQDGEVYNIPLVDGIIINQNNADNTWVLEIFIAKDLQQHFETYRKSNESFNAQVIITSKENEPAPFFVKIHNITEIGENVSILMKGTITERTKYAVELLKSLLTEDFTNEQLLQHFEQGLLERRKLKDM